MKVTNFRTFMVLIFDLIGVTILLFLPFILATTFRDPSYFLIYFISWLPAGFIFALAGFLAKKEEKETMNRDQLLRGTVIEEEEELILGTGEYSEIMKGIPPHYSKQLYFNFEEEQDEILEEVKKIQKEIKDAQI